MKKLLIIAAIGFAGYQMFGKPKENTQPGTPIIQFPGDDLDIKNENVLNRYDNTIIVDADGYWMLVKGGRLYSPISIDTIAAWFKANPDRPSSAVSVPEHVWLDYGQQFANGSF